VVVSCPSGAVLQHHGTDVAGQHRVYRRLGCLLPHHPRCRYPLFCPTPTPLLFPSWLVMDLAFLSPPWVLLLVLFVFLIFLLLLRWFTIFFPFTSLLLTIHVPLNLTLL